MTTTFNTFKSSTFKNEAGITGTYSGVSLYNAGKTELNNDTVIKKL